MNISLHVSFTATLTGENLCFKHAAIRAVVEEDILIEICQGEESLTCDECLKIRQKEEEAYVMPISTSFFKRDPAACPTCGSRLKNAKRDVVSHQDCTDIWHTFSV